MRNSHPGSSSDLCSLVAETKFFVFKPMEHTSSDDYSAYPVPSRPYQGSMPVSIVSPLIAGQAMHFMDNTDVFDHDARLSAYSCPSTTMPSRRLIAPPLTKASSGHLSHAPLLHHSRMRAPSQHAARTHALPLPRAPVHFHRPQYIHKEPTLPIVTPTTNADEFRVIHNVQPLSDKGAEARKMVGLFNVNPPRPPGPVPLQPLPQSTYFPWQTANQQITTRDALPASDLEELSQCHVRRFRSQGVNVKKVDTPHYSCVYCPMIATNTDDLRQHMLTHATDIQWTCPYCPPNTSDEMPKTSLEKHIRSNHPGHAITYRPSRV